MSKRLGGVKGCKYKTSSRHLNGFPDGNNIFVTSTSIRDGVHQGRLININNRLFVFVRASRVTNNVGG